MKKCIMFLSLILFILTFVGCATMPGPDELITKPSVFPKPNSNSALVYFYREKSFFGGAVKYYIYEGEQKIGALESGNYFYHFVSPGEHTYWAKTETEVLISIECKAGRIYYIKGGVRFGLLIGNPTLTEMPTTVGEDAVKELEYRPLTNVSLSK